MFRYLVAAFFVVGSCLSAIAAELEGQSADEAAIRETVKSYVEAYNKADTKALAAFWAPEAVYTNPISGDQVTGREAIEEQFAAIFADNKDARLEAVTESVRFISPNVAVENGKVTVIRPDGSPSESTYSAVYVKQDGAWLLDRVTEEEVSATTSNYEHLKELDWMVGTWVDADDQSRIETTCQWAKNQNFLIRSFAMSVGDRVEMAGMQIVGWDPAQKRLRSWVFDSDGGFNEGVWTKKDNRWYIQATGTLPDGGKTSAVNVITKVDHDTFTWQSINRQAAGELLPNVDEVVVVRKSSE